MMFKRLAWLTPLVAALLVFRTAAAQIAPTGVHYAGRPSDTGHIGPNESGGYAASIPLDLPASRGGLPLPLQVVSGAKGFGAAGVGWDTDSTGSADARTWTEHGPQFTVVSRRENAAGGTIYTADGLVKGKDFDGHVKDALQYTKGPVTVISGGHGSPSGAIQRDPGMLKDDVDNWGAMGATILDVADPAHAGAITGALRGPGTTIGAFCFSGICLDRFY